MTNKKRKRRTKAEINVLKAAIYDVAEKHQPMSVRNLFYRLVVAGVIEKTQREYKDVVVRLTGQMRKDGDMPYDWFIDNTRWMRKPRSYGSLSEMLESSQQLYRRDIWRDQDIYLEVWAESDSAAGLIYSVTQHFDVPLMAARGFSSLTFLSSAADVIRSQNRPAKILYVGDYDPSGVYIDQDIEAKLLSMAPGCEIDVERIAVTPEQIDTHDLPSTPPKKSDARSASFEGQAVEVEAFEPSDLRDIVMVQIAGHLDQDRLAAIQAVEERERETLASMISTL